MSAERVAVMIRDEAGDVAALAMCERWLDAVELAEQAQAQGVPQERIEMRQVREFRVAAA